MFRWSQGDLPHLYWFGMSCVFMLIYLQRGIYLNLEYFIKQSLNAIILSFFSFGCLRATNVNAECKMLISLEVLIMFERFLCFGSEFEFRTFPSHNNKH